MPNMPMRCVVLVIFGLLCSCGGGGGGSSDSTSSGGSGGSSSSLFSPTLNLGGIVCQCGTCNIGVSASSTVPINAIAFTLDTTSSPASGSSSWIPAGNATSINNNYNFTVTSVMNCTAYYNSEICLFGKSQDNQIAGGDCRTVRRIY